MRIEYAGAFYPGAPRANLRQAVPWLNVGYGAYYNHRHDLCGHLFQGRFQAILLDGGPC